MTNIFLYLLKASINLALVYLFYFVALRKLTFFNLNRIILLSGLMLSLVLPLLTYHIHGHPLWKEIPSQIHLSDYQQAGNRTISIQQASDDWKAGTVLYLAFLFYIAGCLAILSRFVFSLFSLWQGIRLAVPQQQSGINLYISDQYKSPFSFFHYCIIPRELAEKDSVTAIVQHEHCHVEQWHSIDIIIIELVSIIFWFNPFVYVYKKAIRSQHEYFVDRMILRKGIKLDVYLQNLCAVSISNNVILTNHFSFQSLKQRIKMVTSKSSASYSRIAYPTFLLLAGILFVFNCCTYEPVIPESAKSAQTFITLSQNIPSILPLDADIGQESQGYGMRMHPIFKIKKFHTGIDFIAPINTDIYATAEGEIIGVSKEYSGFGNMVTISHGDYVTRYAHMNQIFVKEHEKVVKGQVIGTVGNSGLSTAPHLHYEVLFKGKNVDPSDFILLRPVSSSIRTAD